MDLRHVFILIYSIILFIEISTTTPIPEQNKIFTRSIQKTPAIHSSNSLGDGLKSKGSALTDVHATIAQVQKILEADPTLPRLTRGEIEDLFEEVTKEEYEKSVKTGDLSRAKHMRALMLVLPYNVNQTSENDLQELYNRPPITKVISNEPKEVKKQKIVVPSGKVEIVNITKQNPTTYKPHFRIKPLKTIPDPTTYRPKTPTPKPTPRTTTTKVFVTTTPTSTAAPTSASPTVTAKNRYSSHFNLQQAGLDDMPFKPIPTNPQPIDPELEDILKSLGFSAQSQTKKRSKVEKPPPTQNEELSKRMLSSTLRQDNVAESFASLPSSPKLAAQDFKGLMPSISARDFGTFKPIPDSSGEVSPDLEAYLKQFGLFPPFESRSQKAIKPAQQTITKRVDVNVPDIHIAEIRESVQTTTKSPSKSKAPNQDEEDFKQLQQLLKTLRELQELNATLSKEALEKLDPRHFNLSQTLLSQGPNPLLEAEFDLSKNEIKRQTESPEPIKFSLDLNLDDDASSSSSDSTTTTTEEASTDATPSNDIDKIFVVTPEAAFNAPETTSTTTTEETPRNNIAELGDSFAGGLGDAENAEPLPPPRKNGFYFLSDWNSFLEVGEDPDKIVVRFDPKVGDPSRFIPVNVP